MTMWTIERDVRWGSNTLLIIMIYKTNLLTTTPWRSVHIVIERSLTDVNKSDAYCEVRAYNRSNVLEN